jgi:hypothetical protein
MILAASILVALTFGFLLGLLTSDVRGLFREVRRRPILEPEHDPEVDEPWDWPPFPSSCFTDEREAA